MILLTPYVGGVVVLFREKTRVRFLLRRPPGMLGSSLLHWRMISWVWVLLTAGSQEDCGLTVALTGTSSVTVEFSCFLSG